MAKPLPMYAIYQLILGDIGTSSKFDSCFNSILADPNFYERPDIDMLLGAEIYFDIL